MEKNILVYTLDSFPPLKESVQRLNAFFLEPEIDRNAFAEVIESDPMLYSDVLHYVNAPYYGFRSQIKSIRQAISLVGVMMVRGFAMKSTLKTYTENDMSPYGITLGQWLQTMQRQQHFLYRWLMAEDSTILARLGGVMFMLEMGRLAVSYVLSYTDTSHTLSSPTPYELLNEERELIGEHGDELAAQLFEKWNFEPEFIDLFRHSLDSGNAQNRRLAAVLEITRRLISIRGVHPLEEVQYLIVEHGFTYTNVESAYNEVLATE